MGWKARVWAVAGAAMSRRVCAGARGLMQGNAMSYARECVGCARDAEEYLSVFIKKN